MPRRISELGGLQGLLGSLGDLRQSGMVHLNLEGGIELIELIEGGLQKRLQAPLRICPRILKFNFEKELEGGLEKGELLEGT